METVKNALAVLVAIIGAVTALLTLYAKYLDVKKSAQKESDAADAALKAASLPLETKARLVVPEDDLIDLIDLVPTDDYRPSRGLATVERARQAVKAPAITLIVAGFVCLFTNVLVAGYGYVDRFVTPLSEESAQQQAFRLNAANAGPSYSRAMPSPGASPSDGPFSVMVVFVLLALCIPSAAAIWAGFGMLRLRGYWLSVAGSFAIMPAGLGCCLFGGIPVGLWSLSVLYRPEVAAAFD